MSSHRAITMTLLVAAMALWTGCSDPDRKDQAKHATVLFLHGGAWVGGTAAELEPLAATYRDLGYNAISVEYRDGDNDILHLIDNVQTQVSKHQEQGPVILYGVSAGGTLAAALAATGKVDGAVVIGAPTDLPTWSANPYEGSLARKVLDALGMTAEQVRAASPITRLSRPAPQLLQYGDRDEFVPLQQGATYARAARKLQPDIIFDTLKGVDHTGALAYTPAYAERAQAWIQQRWPADGALAVPGPPAAAGAAPVRMLA